jgi:hypothetical protein
MTLMGTVHTYQELLQEDIKAGHQRPEFIVKNYVDLKDITPMD